ncbi:4Fe-4S dicluster domain-containing protein [Adlercreutzia caecimuris]|uniref:4Fe-4S dicluster domain-containing protein n=1 Tax=Adlercreutzia caecimuris TaxID=671266 RepID=UPI002729B858|nr:4Fe-4S dicluster domain-containing protein [Adlercreutzia caecimuris]
MKRTIDGIDGSANVTRRGVIVGALSVAGLFALGFTGRAFAGEASLVRPPGGQDESRFLSLCLRCDKCRSVCPLDCISTAPLEDGIVNARTPYLNFEKGYCDFCNLCIDVCPVRALEPFDPSVNKVGIAVVDEDECVAWKQTGCTICAEVCPFDAITLSETGKPIVDIEACNGCGLCENACPSASYMHYAGARRRGINIEGGQA